MSDVRHDPHSRLCRDTAGSGCRTSDMSLSAGLSGRPGILPVRMTIKYYRNRFGLV